MECAFCNLLKQADNDSLICKMNHGSLYVNLDQYYRGRVMYVYNKHVQDFTELDFGDKNNLVFKELIVIGKGIKDMFKADLMNISSLGNHVQHLHWHIIPRYKDGENWGKPPWPHERKYVDNKNLRNLAVKIRNHLMKSSDFQELIEDEKVKIPN